MAVPSQIERDKVEKKFSDLRRGDRFTNTCGKVAEVISFKKYTEVTVRFEESGYVNTFQLGALKRGHFKDLIYGIGFNSGRHVAKTSDNSISKCYDCWRRILFRSTTEWWEKHPTYTGTSVCDEWKDYSSFADWYSISCNNLDWDLDKDLLLNGNKQYSPEHCCFIPEEINKAIVVRSKLTGVSKKGNLFEVYFRSKYVGNSRCFNEAQELYRKTKESEVRSLANTPHLSENARNALKNFSLGIEDGYVVRIK